MPCEFCGPDDDVCSVCEKYTDPSRDSYRRKVIILCAAGMLVLINAAVVCAVVNQLGRAGQ